MKFLFLLLAAGLLYVVERFGTRWALDQLAFGEETDKFLVAPEEKVTLLSTTENHSRLPLPFIRLQIPFPQGTRFFAEESWSRRHLREGFQNRYLEERFSLKGRQKSVKKLTFSLPKRGVYAIGPYRIAAGDLLGFTESAKSSDGTEITVMPEEARNPGLLETFGGFLGDISVRRFLLEDPILTAGFRDYTGTDPMKNISWTRTAMAGSLQVKQFDHTAEQTATVLLDTAEGTPEELEACFRLTRTVCQQLERRKIPYDFRTNGNLTGPTGKIFHLAEGLGEIHLNTLLYGLGRADYMNYFTREQLVRRTLERRKSNSFYVVITPCPEAAPAFRPLEEAGDLCILDGRREAE